MDTLTMAYSRKKAEQIITGLEDPLNVHLVKLLGLAAEESLRNVWKREVKSWLRRIAKIQVKPQHRYLPAQNLFAWLFEEPYGGAEARNVEALLAIEADGIPRNGETAQDISARLRSLHEAIAPRLAAGDPCGEVIDAL